MQVKNKTTPIVFKSAVFCFRFKRLADNKKTTMNAIEMAVFLIHSADIISTTWLNVFVSDEKYNKNGIFPLVVLLDKTGKIMGMTGFKNVSAVDYIELIHSFEK